MTTHSYLKKGLFAALVALALFIDSRSLLVAGEPELSGKELVINDEAPWITPSLSSRLRYEYGDQSSLDDSHAGTIRNRVGVLSKEFYGFQAFAEYEGTLAVDRDSYRAASVHGPASKTIIADPESHELNQLWVSQKNDFFTLKAGRQVIKLDGDRFIGDVGWRQNQQTYDAARFTFAPATDLSVDYTYVNRVNRIFGSQVEFAPQTDFEGNSHLVNASYKGLPFGTLTTYAYFLDLGNEAGDIQSNNTYGVSLAGPLFEEASYYAEYAYQTDAFDSPLDYGTSYAHGSVSSPIVAGFKGTVGFEYLGSDNGCSFRTPLATGHKFNGFADRFLTTPAGGLSDAYVSVGTKLPWDINATVFYHHFWDADVDTAFGQEVDLVLAKSLGNGFSAMIKGAMFAGQGSQPDVNRAIFQIEYKY